MIIWYLSLECSHWGSREISALRTSEIFTIKVKDNGNVNLFWPWAKHLRVIFGEAAFQLSSGKEHDCIKCWHLVKQTGKHSATSLDWNWNSAPHQMAETIHCIATHFRSVGFPNRLVCVSAKVYCVSVLTSFQNASWDVELALWRRWWGNFSGQFSGCHHL
jgi:hypothetical protein